MDIPLMQTNDDPTPFLKMIRRHYFTDAPEEMLERVKGFCRAQAWDVNDSRYGCDVTIPTSGEGNGQFIVSILRSRTDGVAMDIQPIGIDRQKSAAGIALLEGLLGFEARRGIVFPEPARTLEEIPPPGQPNFNTLMYCLPNMSRVPDDALNWAADAFEYFPRESLLLLARMMGIRPHDKLRQMHTNSLTCDTPQNARLILHMARDMLRRGAFNDDDLNRWSEGLAGIQTPVAQLMRAQLLGEPLPISPTRLPASTVLTESESKSSPPGLGHDPLFRGLTTSLNDADPRRVRGQIEEAFTQSNIPFERHGDWIVRSPTLCVQISQSFPYMYPGSIYVNVSITCYMDDEVSLMRIWSTFRSYRV